MLKPHGHPAKVAHRYREQPGRGLISPALFPFYWFTLRATLALWVTIRVIVAVFALQGTSPAGTILLGLGRDVLLAGIIIPPGITLRQRRSHYRNAVRKVPALHNPIL
jgi:hypothetical protein